MRHGRATRLVFGSAGAIAGTVYGTIIVMATVTAGSYGEPTAVCALGIGVATLGVQGARYATVEQLDRTGTLGVIAINVVLGLVIVALKALLAH